MNTSVLICLCITAFFSPSFSVVLTTEAENITLSETDVDEIEERILNGTTAKPGQFPWMALITWNQGKRQSHCSAFIISPTTILTAGHCVGNKKNGTFTAILGSVNHTEAKGKPLEIKETTMHPQYNKKGYKNDIAVMKLSKPIQLSKTVKPICVESKTTEHKFALSMGWGKAENHTCNSKGGKISDVLLYSKQRVLKDEKLFINTVGQRTKICKGDSGGPLVDFQKFHGKETPVAIGILSTGDKQSHANYTRISAQLEFIKKHVKDVKIC